MTSISIKTKYLSCDVEQLILDCGSDILNSKGMEFEKTQRHHGRISCFEHSVAVAYISVWLATIFRIKVDAASLIRGALLHDYFLYNWREEDIAHTSHALTHAKTACKNAHKEFGLNKIERDIITKHMYPITPKPPLYKESILVCIADKLSAVMEVLSLPTPKTSPGINYGKKLK